MGDTHLTGAILVVADQQMRDNTPPETRHTFERLVALGYAPEDARRRSERTATGRRPMRDQHTPLTSNMRS
jgi:hypothetical protein